MHEDVLTPSHKTRQRSFMIMSCSTLYQPPKKWPLLTLESNSEWNHGHTAICPGIRIWHGIPYWMRLKAPECCNSVCNHWSALQQCSCGKHFTARIYIRKARLHLDCASYKLSYWGQLYHIQCNLQNISLFATATQKSKKSQPPCCIHMKANTTDRLTTIVHIKLFAWAIYDGQETHRQASTLQICLNNQAPMISQSKLTPRQDRWTADYMKPLPNIKVQ